jgi:hypothetical protein
LNRVDDKCGKEVLLKTGLWFQTVNLALKMLKLNYEWPKLDETEAEQLYSRECVLSECIGRGEV